MVVMCGYGGGGKVDGWYIAVREGKGRMISSGSMVVVMEGKEGVGRKEGGR